MNLINYSNENTLPEQVSVNKANIELLADEVDKLGFTPRGEYDASAEYVYNDVVFYNYKLYAMIDEDATIVGVLPTDTTKWQVITGNIKGETGAQGPQGAQGATGATGAAGTNGTDGQDGTDGVNSLNYNKIYTSDNAPNLSATYYTSSTNFSRTAISNDVFNLVYKDTTTDYIYLCVCEITNAASYGFRIINFVRVSGENGATGKSALVCDQTISLASFDPTQDPQLISYAIYYSHFNRTPELNDDFVCYILNRATNIVYVAQAEVQTKNVADTYVATFVVSQIVRVSGQDGAQGAQGETGNGIASIEKTATVGLVDTYTITFTDGTTTTFNVTNGQGKQLYQHCFSYFYETTSHRTMAFFNIINDSATSMSNSDIATWLYNNGFTTDIKGHMATGRIGISSTYYRIMSVYATSTTNITFGKESYTGQVGTIYNDYSASFTEDIIAL